MKGAIYARFSSDNQRDESIDAQVRACEEYAKRNDIQIVKIYADRAKSATSDKRPEFQHMITDSGASLFDCVLIHKLDRFSRDKYDSAKYKRRLKQNGIKLISVTENLDGSPESIILESLLEGMAEYYSKNLAREVMKGMKENALKCQHTGGRPPLGYDVDPVTKKYLINEEEAIVVREIFDLYVTGYGYKRMVDELNSKGRLTKLGKPFVKNSLHDILCNEKYAGVYTYNRSTSKDSRGRRNNHSSKDDDDLIRIPGGMPAIITAETFSKAKAKMKQNQKQPGAYKAKEIYLLSGLMVCGECLKREGKVYSMMGNCNHSGRSKLKHVTYRCSNRANRKSCDNKEIRREYIENYVLSQLEKNIFSEQAIPILVKKLNDYQSSASSSHDKEIEALKGELYKVEKNIRNIVDAVAAGSAHSSLVDRLTELEQRKADMETSIAEMSLKQTHNEITEEMVRGLFKNFRKFIAEKNVFEVRKFISSYVEKVIVYKDHVEVVFFFSCGGIEIEDAYRFKKAARRTKLKAG